MVLVYKEAPNLRWTAVLKQVMPLRSIFTKISTFMHDKNGFVFLITFLTLFEMQQPLKKSIFHKTKHN